MKIRYFKEKVEDVDCEIAYWKLVYSDDGLLKQISIKEYEEVKDPWFELSVKEYDSLRISNYFYEDTAYEYFTELTKKEMFFELI